MARSHAKILVQVWRDAEWVALGGRAQWLYTLLLSQPKLTLVGSLEVTVGRWAHLGGYQPHEVQESLDRLEERSWVLIDHTTEELLIRTFTTHDLDPNRVNVNLAKGLWGQWACLASADLRRQAVRLMPAKVWDKLEPHAPPDAVQIRRSARLEPGEPSGLRPQHPPRFEPPPSSHLPTDTCHRPAGAAPDEPAVDNPRVLTWVERAEAKAAEASRRNLRVVENNPKPAAGAMSPPVHVEAPRTNGAAT